MAGEPHGLDRVREAVRQGSAYGSAYTMRNDSALVMTSTKAVIDTKYSNEKFHLGLGLGLVFDLVHIYVRDQSSVSETK